MHKKLITKKNKIKKQTKLSINYLRAGQRLLYLLNTLKISLKNRVVPQNCSAVRKTLSDSRKQLQ